MAAAHPPRPRYDAEVWVEGIYDALPWTEAYGASAARSSRWRAWSRALITYSHPPLSAQSS